MFDHLIVLLEKSPHSVQVVTLERLIPLTFSKISYNHYLRDLYIEVCCHCQKIKVNHSQSQPNKLL